MAQGVWEMNEGLYVLHPALGLFIRLYARLICCPCMDQSCMQCKIDIEEMNASGLIDVAAKINPQIAKLKAAGK